MYPTLNIEAIKLFSGGILAVSTTNLPPLVAKSTVECIAGVTALSKDS